MNVALPTNGIAGPWDILIGAQVVDCAGEPLGRVIEADVSDLHVRRWFFTPILAIPLAHVARYDAGALWLDVSRAKLRQTGKRERR